GHEAAVQVDDSHAHVPAWPLTTRPTRTTGPERPPSAGIVVHASRSRSRTTSGTSTLMPDLHHLNTRFRMNLSFLGMIAPCLLALASPGEGLVCQPAYVLDDVIRMPMQTYVPQPGDIFLATDRRLWYRVGHTITGAHGVHHSGIVFARPDG